MRTFSRDERGNVAILFGLTTLPICVLVGSAVDYGRAINFRDYARSAADAGALAVASADIPDDGSTMLAGIRSQITARYGANAQNVTVTGDWIDGGTYRVKVGASVKAYLLPAVPGLGTNGQTLQSNIEIRVARIPPKYQATAPTLSQLSPEAADYNRIYMYCYDPSRKNESDKGRRAMTAIADNGDPGKDYSKNKAPTCNEGELVSYKLRNVRNMRATPSKWDATGQEVYEYYTDSTINPATRVMTNNMSGGRVYDNGSVDAMDMQNNPILETILCDNASQCREKSAGGILPNNHETGRTAATATGGCAEGKMMYYGWEDRPPNAGSDRDYDDIRVIVTCPKMIKIADKQVHLIQ